MVWPIIVVDIISFWRAHAAVQLFKSIENDVDLRRRCSLFALLDRRRALLISRIVCFLLDFDGQVRLIDFFHPVRANTRGSRTGRDACRRESPTAPAKYNAVMYLQSCVFWGNAIGDRQTLSRCTGGAKPSWRNFGDCKSSPPTMTVVDLEQCRIDPYSRDNLSAHMTDDGDAPARPTRIRRVPRLQQPRRVSVSRLRLRALHLVAPPRAVLPHWLQARWPGPVRCSPA